MVHPANIQDRHGAPQVLAGLANKHPCIKRILADSAYKGRDTEKTLNGLGPWQVEIVAKQPGINRFVVLPRRWVVERTFAWMGRCRRLAKDFEHRTRTARAFILLAMIRLMLRRIARACT